MRYLNEIMNSWNPILIEETMWRSKGHGKQAWATKWGTRMGTIKAGESVLKKFPEIPANRLRAGDTAKIDRYVFRVTKKKKNDGTIETYDKPFYYTPHIYQKFNENQ